MEVNICFGINDAYCQHVGCVVASILYNSCADDSYTFYIITDFISEQNKIRLEQLKSIRPFKIVYFVVDNKDFNNIKLNHLGYASLYRLKSIELIPADKIIYLDADLIVRHNIGQLFETDLGNYLCAGAEDLIAPRKKQELNMNPNCHYVNAGVLVFNLKQCRKENYSEKLFAYISEQKTGDDQESINYTMQDRIKPIDLKWNCTLYWNMYEDQNYFNKMAQDPSIIHFIGPRKPWVAGFYPNFWQDYFKYLKLTPWYDEFMDILMLDGNRVLMASLEKIHEKLESLTVRTSR